MKPGDIITVFGNPIALKYPVGKAKLIKPISKQSKLEQWEVEYLDDEGHTYMALIKKDDGENKTQ